MQYLVRILMTKGVNQFQDKTDMKDQRALATKCLKNDIPFFTLCGNDELAVETLKFYLNAAIYRGCNQEFILDLKELLADFKAFKTEEPEKMKIPD